MIKESNLTSIDFSSHKCLICDRLCDGRRSLGNHLSKVHPEWDIKRYTLHYFMGNTVPTCACGCGQTVSWQKVHYTFSDYVSGHNSNGFQENAHTQAANAKRAATVSAGKVPKQVKRRKTQPVSQSIQRDYVEQLGIDKLEKLLLILDLAVERNVRVGSTLTSESQFDVFIEEQNVFLAYDPPEQETGDGDLSYLDWISQSLQQNLIAKEQGLNLYRIRSDSGWHDCRSLEDLKRISYHSVEKSQAVKEGTFRFRDDEHSLISRESMIRFNETDLFTSAPGRDFTESRILPLVRDIFKLHSLYWGWFYPTTDETLREAIRSVSDRTDVSMTAREISSTTHAGSAFLRERFKSYWDVDGGPSKAFLDDKKLNSVLKYRLGLNNSKPYEYLLDDGSKITCRETFDINTKNVRRGFVVQRNAVSFFKPAAAYHLMSRYLVGVQSPVVWDPSGGFGGRLLGFAALAKSVSGTYLACEPATATFRDLLLLSADISLEFPKIRVSLTKAGSETDLSDFLDDSSVDLVITSPPYYDREKYFDEPGQCWLDFPSKSLWRTGYLMPTMQNAFRCLKSGGHTVFNVDDACRDDVVWAAESVGLILKDELKLTLGRDHFSRKANHTESKTEPILVFVKP